VIDAPRVGFVGLGAMGSRMASRLVDAGYDVIVHNRTRGREADLVQRGASSATTPCAVAAGADIVVGCLLDDDALRQVYLGEDGMVATARPDQIFVEHGTFSPALAREISAVLTARGACFVDAPVSGGPEGAAKGTLTAMVGGDDRHVAAATDVLRAYCAHLVHVGPPGAGLELKLINQLLVSSHAAAAAEAAVLIGRMEIPLDIAASVLNASWASSAMLSRLFERRLADADAVSEATIGGLAAPQRLVRELLAAHDFTPPVGNAALDMFTDARGRGRDDHDLTDLLDGAPC
jgi:3-hydroxyisobutyrate dehydrogenase-like beta-hydroxyacid dehydrogenase